MKKIIFSVLILICAFGAFAQTKTDLCLQSSITEEGGLSLRATVNNTMPKLNERIKVTVTLTNNSNQTLTDVEISVLLPTGLVYVGSKMGESNGRVGCRISSVDIGQSGSFEFSCDVAQKRDYALQIFAKSYQQPYTTTTLYISTQ